MKKNRKCGDLIKLTSGPCRWTQAFGIGRVHNGESIEENIFVFRGFSRKKNVVAAKRIGVEYAVGSKDLPLRFYLRNSPFVSRK